MTKQTFKQWLLNHHGTTEELWALQNMLGSVYGFDDPNYLQAKQAWEESRKESSLCICSPNWLKYHTWHHSECPEHTADHCPYPCHKKESDTSAGAVKISHLAVAKPVLVTAPADQCKCECHSLFARTCSENAQGLCDHCGPRDVVQQKPSEWISERATEYQRRGTLKSPVAQGIQAIFDYLDAHDR